VIDLGSVAIGLILGLFVGGSVAMFTLEEHSAEQPGGVRAPGAQPADYTPRTQEQRTWADLLAACRLVDGWLGSDVDGKPICYPMAQGAKP